MVELARCSRSEGFSVLRVDSGFVVAMTAGSIAGTVLGGLLLGVVPDVMLVPLLSVLLVASAVEVWSHR